MKDIDFDELDKAVNSLMTRAQKTDKTPQASTAPSRDEPDIPDTAAPVSPGTIKPKSAIATNPDVQPAVTPEPAAGSSSGFRRPTAPATRRSGRFMDVVPKKQMQTPPVRPISREAATITPRAGVDIAEPQPSTPAESTFAPAAVSGSQPMATPAQDNMPPKNDWPDPIELTAEPNEPRESEPATDVVPEDNAKPAKVESEPLSSPFLPDAKVEKRPLGGATQPTSSLPMEAPESELSAVPKDDDSKAQLPALPSDVAPESPEEFNDDLMKVEADTHMGMPKTDEIHPSAETPVEPAEKEVVEEPVVSDTPVPTSPTETEDTALSGTPTGRISIPQQYKEEPSTGDEASGAIYDTDTYHKPLTHPAKKKSGWLWVVWIVLILLVGAGAGAALYFLGVM